VRKAVLIEGVYPGKESELRSLVILMIEEEQPEGLSARKLVVETVKHNVLTAYNAKDGVDLLRRFPNVDAILVHSGQLAKWPNLLGEVKELCPGKPIILDSHQPPALLKLLGEDMQD
jgi:hypothetical protein